MSHKIFFHPEAGRKYKDLASDLRKLVDKKLHLLMQEPLLGKPLGKVNNTNLSGCYKLYFDHKKRRIVYRLHGDRILIEAIYIVAIGKREKMKVYAAAAKRMRDLRDKRKK